ncbi:UPF0175 family protein [Geitlerinema sp. CS-897]|nr:UPF0175 family protein [Geitlerinema sp. CS-897]
MELLSQEKAAEVAGLTRAKFIETLSRYRVSPFQTDLETLREEFQDLSE